MLKQINLEPLSTGELLMFDEQWKRVAAKRVHVPKAFRFDNPSGVVYARDGDFTVAILGGLNDDLYVGVSKRSPRDKMNEDIGKTIAFCRAARKAITLETGRTNDTTSF